MTTESQSLSAVLEERAEADTEGFHPDEFWTQQSALCPRQSALCPVHAETILHDSPGNALTRHTAVHFRCCLNSETRNVSSSSDALLSTKQVCMFLHLRATRCKQPRMVDIFVSSTNCHARTHPVASSVTWNTALWPSFSAIAKLWSAATLIWTHHWIRGSLVIQNTAPRTCLHQNKVYK